MKFPNTIAEARKNDHSSDGQKALADALFADIPVRNAALEREALETAVRYGYVPAAQVRLESGQAFRGYRDAGQFVAGRGWLPGVSFRAHGSAQMKGVTYDRLAELADQFSGTDLIRAIEAERPVVPAKAAVPAPLCPTCGIELPLSGTCDYC
jgi:hypothetical protein